MDRQRRAHDLLEPVAGAQFRGVREHVQIGELAADANRGAQSAAASLLYDLLYDLLWKPIQASIGTSQHVVVSPDGALNLLPFAALRDGTTGKYLVESATITYVSSGRDLLRGGGGMKPGADLFVAADPSFDLAAATGGDPGEYRGPTRSKGFAMKFAPLDGTAEEARKIPGLLPGGAKQVRTGAEATEPAVLSARRPKVMHLATHGFFLEDQKELPIESGGLMADRQARLPAGYENPLLRSGLAFAGANHAAKAASSMDGLLTALEVSGMDLHGTDLVTLSACETGVGEVKTGEGVFGLRRAFALAGTRNLMMSLWDVEDRVTAEQMDMFYRLYGQGEAPSAALRTAQLDTIGKLRAKYGEAAPLLWAPFIMQGRP